MTSIQNNLFQCILNDSRPQILWRKNSKESFEDITHTRLDLSFLEGYGSLGRRAARTLSVNQEKNVFTVTYREGVRSLKYKSITLYDSTVNTDLSPIEKIEFNARLNTLTAISEDGRSTKIGVDVSRLKMLINDPVEGVRPIQMDKFSFKKVGNNKFEIYISEDREVIKIFLDENLIWSWVEGQGHPQRILLDLEDSRITLRFSTYLHIIKFDQPGINYKVHFPENLVGHFIDKSGNEVVGTIRCCHIEYDRNDNISFKVMKGFTCTRVRLGDNEVWKGEEDNELRKFVFEPRSRKLKFYHNSIPSRDYHLNAGELDKFDVQIAQNARN